MHLLRIIAIDAITLNLSILLIYIWATFGVALSRQLKAGVIEKAAILYDYIHILLYATIYAVFCVKDTMLLKYWNQLQVFFLGFFKRFSAVFFSRFLINWQWPMQMLLAFWLGHRYIYTEPKIQIQLHCQRSKTAPAAYGIQFKNVSKRYITHYGHGLPSLDLEIPFTAFFPTPKARQKSRDTFVRMYICMYVCLYVRYMYVCIYGEVAFWGLYIYRYFSGLWSLLVLVSWLQGLHDTQFPPTSVFSDWDWVVAVFIRIVVNFIRV